MAFESNKILKKIKTLLILLTMGSVYGQVYNKFGNNPFDLNPSAALEVESIEKGFLPPRMTMVQRDAISKPAASLIVWCSDCNKSTTPASGQFCIYADDRWNSVLFSTTMTSSLTTGKKDDVNAPVMINDHSVQINGLLVNTFGAPPNETGVLYREIATNADYGKPLFLDTSGNAATPVYKAVSGPTSTTSGSAISTTIDMISATGNTRPYYFRTYAKNAATIGYGNVVIFNVAPPKFSPVTVTDGNTASPKFASNLTINAGTLPKVTEYGYCSSTIKTSPTTDDNKVVISTSGDITALNANLNKDAFTADLPVINLAVTNYEVKISDLTYFRYYVIINGIPYYSDVTSFTPLGLATIDGLDPISSTLTTGVASGSFFRVRFNPVKTGRYSFVSKAPTGATKGLSIVPMSGEFVAGTPKVLDFLVSGTPYGSLEGNSFVVPGVGTLVTKKIAADPITAGSAVVSFLDTTLSGQLKYGKVSTSVFNVRFNVIKSGDYSFTVEKPTGATTGLSIASPVTGSFADADMGTIKTVAFTVTGTPITSFDGNSFVVSGITTPFSTGAILDRDPTGNAICDGSVPTKVVEVISKTGATWMDRNLGASEVAASATDFKAYGCLFQWGRGNDGHASINWTSGTAGTIVNNPTPVLATTPTPGNAFIKTTDLIDWLSSKNDKLWQGLNGINNPCPSDYRLPTITEFNLEFTTSKVMNATDAYNKSVLKVPSSGYIVNSGVFNGVADRFFLWSSTTNIVANPKGAISYNGYINSTDNPNLARSFGFSVRCIKDNSGEVINTGGASVATITSIDPISGPALTAGVNAANTTFIRVHFAVSTPGTYFFTPALPTGATKGLNIAPVSGSFIGGKADETVDFPVTGVPYDSLEGNSFLIAGAKILVTGAILPNPVTGGSAVATFLDSSISKQLKISEASASKIIARFNVTKTGSYDVFTPTALASTTTGLSLSPSLAGTFTATDTPQTVEFIVNGTPTGSMDGNSFDISNTLSTKIGTIKTGTIAYNTAIFTVNRSEVVSPVNPLKIGTVTNGNLIRVYLDITRAGTYAGFVVTSTGGATTGLSLDSVPTGTFTSTTGQYIDFPIKGTPETSLDGNSFYVSGMASSLSTGKILPFQAICDNSAPTTVVEVTSLTTKVWMDRNLGASRAAISITDYQGFGCLFQWGRGNDGAASTNWTSSTAGTLVNGTVAGPVSPDTPGKAFITTSNSTWQTSTNTRLWQGVDSRNNNPCPATYRIPTYSELKSERDAYTMILSGAYGSILKFPKASYYLSSGNISGDYTIYMRTANGYIALDNTGENQNPSMNSALGMPVRCIKN